LLNKCILQLYQICQNVILFISKIESKTIATIVCSLYRTICILEVEISILWKRGTRNRKLMYFLQNEYLPCKIFVSVDCGTFNIICLDFEQLRRLKHHLFFFNFSDASSINKFLRRFASVRIEYDLESLSAKNQECLKLLVEASKVIDKIWAKQMWSQSEAFFSYAETLDKNSDVYKYIKINKGPWSELD